ncbi:hypothetical protein BH20ACI3_BH20ACI3_05990 [soil metagenome]
MPSAALQLSLLQEPPLAPRLPAWGPRLCPKCQNEQANVWLAEQQNLLLPIHHFLVTFTLPEELRALARSHQKLIYNLLFRASAAALLQLAQDPRFVGRLGMVGVLHTWTRQLLYHPHVHYIVMV